MNAYSLSSLTGCRLPLSRRADFRHGAAGKGDDRESYPACHKLKKIKSGQVRHRNDRF